MAGLINWKKVAITGSNPDADHVYIGVDSADGKLYLKNSAGTVYKYPVATDVTAEITTAINNLVDGAPAALDTLNELAAALADDANFASTVTTALSGKESTIASGTTNDFWRGDKTWVNFATTVLSTVLTGISFATSSAVLATDTILVALGKLQAQITTLFNRTITAGYGLTGGGNLTADRTLAVSLTSSEVSATNNITTTSATNVLMTGMTLTPAAGSYLVLFSASVFDGNDDSTITTSIYAGGTLQSGSETQTEPNVSGGISNPNSTTMSATTFSIVTVNGSLAIEGRWRRSAGTAGASYRHLKAIRIG